MKTPLAACMKNHVSKCTRQVTATNRALQAIIEPPGRRLAGRMQQTASEEAGVDRQREACDKSKRQRRSAWQEDKQPGHRQVRRAEVGLRQELDRGRRAGTGPEEGRSRSGDKQAQKLKDSRTPNALASCFSVSCAEAAASKVHLQFGSSLRALLRFSPGPCLAFLPHPPTSLNMRVGPSSPPSSSQHRHNNSGREDEGGRTSGPKRC